MTDAPRPERVEPLRHVIIGAGAAVMTMHRPALELDSVEVVGACDLNPARAAKNLPDGCPIFSELDKLLEAVPADVAVIMTPHTAHAAPVMRCLQAGLHVLVEKPMAVHVGDADDMIRAADTAGPLLAVNLQQRLRPEVAAARRLIDQGRLGALQRIDVQTNWPRTIRYYEEVPWRGMWTVQGGGVLLNQAPHDLDLLCHLAGGLPDQVFAWTRTLLHDIVAEDTAAALLEWRDGMLATLHITTAQAPARTRIEVTGTKGSLRLGSGTLRFTELETDFRVFSLDRSQDPYTAPAAGEIPVALEPGEGSHAALYRNLHEAIRCGAPLIADGREGRMSLELANAIILSSETSSAVQLPLDRARYLALLQRVRARGPARQPTRRIAGAAAPPPSTKAATEVHSRMP